MEASRSTRMNVQHITLPDREIELRLDASLSPAVLRAFLGTTPLDATVDALPVPVRPLWLRICVYLLRWYRRHAGSLGLANRCVFDPSCSRYSELSFRRSGLLKGSIATIARLSRCKPGQGGVDTPTYLNDRR
jgi:putative component of membrane protein insertase Oxa1/YidC/SpoIIIJ protein YidD